LGAVVVAAVRSVESAVHVGCGLC